MYGVESMDVRNAASALESLLGVRFHRRESSYKGGEYFLASFNSGGEITVEVNWVDEDGDLAEPEYANFSVLVYANKVNVGTLASISAAGLFTLLRSDEL